MQQTQKITKPVRVMIIDDSALVRQVLRRILESDPRIRVIATAADPFEAADCLKKEAPDVIILDLEMPRMDGLTFLRKLMAQHPVPVIVCSGRAGLEDEAGNLALEAGAVEILRKPKIGTLNFLEESRLHFCKAIHAAARCGERVRRRREQPSEKLTADVVLGRRRKRSILGVTDKVIVIGASTGGTEALRVLLQGLPIDSPGTIVVQHMPEHFTAAFARRLHDLCRVEVKEAEKGDLVTRGRVLIAPGNKHTILRRSGSRYYVDVRDGPLVSRQRPSVDVLFRSAAEYAGANTVAALLTGMGDDGARGMEELKEAGAFNIVQDEPTSVVWGMPAEAVKRGVVDLILPIDRIAPELIRRTLQGSWIQS